MDEISGARRALSSGSRYASGSAPEPSDSGPRRRYVRWARTLSAAFAVAMCIGLTAGSGVAAAAPDSSLVSPETTIGASPETTSPAVVSGSDRPDGAFVDILEVEGRIDPVSADFLVRSFAKAELDGAQAVVVQLNSSGSVLSAAAEAELLAAVADSRVPVAVWVGPSGARARGGAVELLRAAAIAGVGGDITVQPREGAAMSAAAARSAGLAEIEAPVLADFIGQLDGRTLGGVELDTAADPAKDAKGRTTAALRTVRFQRLGLFEQLLHNMANPGITFLFLAIGLALAVFEFFTGGVGMAGAVAVICAGLGAYGLGVLPTRPIGAVLVVGSFLAFAIDVQAGQPRFWTGVGTVALAAGSRILFGGGVAVPLWWAAIVVVMIVVFMVGGMPTMIRTRFATPTIGREAMIGELGTAQTDVSPEGIAVVRGAPWRARTNRATPIPAGSALRVAALDGLMLEVEPLEGAARDHRERRPAS